MMTGVVLFLFVIVHRIENANVLMERVYRSANAVNKMKKKTGYAPLGGAERREGGSASEASGSSTSVQIHHDAFVSSLFVLCM